MSIEDIMLNKNIANVDLILAIGIHRAYERQYSGTIVEIERSTSPSIPSDVDLFTMAVEPPDCQCTPRCKIDIIALHHKEVCAFLSEVYYDRIEAVIDNIRKMAEEASKR